MKELELNSWEEFEEEIQKLFSYREDLKKASKLSYVSKLLFRGQSNSSWKLETTLERSAPKEFLNVGRYFSCIDAAKSQIETYTGQKWEFSHDEYTSYLGILRKSKEIFGLRSIPGYDYMIYLRHHGFPSPLLDWSHSPFIASFFAFNHIEEGVERVAVFAYLEYTGAAKSGWADDAHISARGPYVRSHRRHFVQQSEYTICAQSIDNEWRYVSHEGVFVEGKKDQDLLWKFTLPSSERLKILKILDRYNLNSFSLFGSEESLMETISSREMELRN